MQFPIVTNKNVPFGFNSKQESDSDSENSDYEYDSQIDYSDDQGWENQDIENDTNDNRVNINIKSNNSFDTRDDFISNSVGSIKSNGVSYDPIQPWRKTISQDNYSSCWIFKVGNGELLIGTCYHCVQDAVPEKGLVIHFPGTKDTEWLGTVLAVCPSEDCALVSIKQDIMGNKINPNDWRELDIDEKSILRIEEKVLAYGYPLGQETIKISSCNITGIEKGSIQLDGSINEGNSGGPIMMNGKVVGWIDSGIEQASNISFAQPIRLFLNFAYRYFLSKGKNKVIRRVGLGIRIQNNTKFIVAANCYPNSNCFIKQGALLKWISSYSPFSKSPFFAEPGDILVSINDKTGKAVYDSFPEKIYPLDNQGNVSVQWSKQPIPIGSFFANCNESYPVIVKLWKSKQSKWIESEIILENYFFNGLRDIVTPYEFYKYSVFGGIIAIASNSNTLSEFPQYDESDLKEKELPAIIIGYIYPSSYFGSSGNLQQGQIISKINDIPVTTIQEYNDAILKPWKGKFLKVETKEGYQDIAPIDGILKDEKNLANTFSFVISPIYSTLMKNKNNY